MTTNDAADRDARRRGWANEATALVNRNVIDGHLTAALYEATEGKTVDEAAAIVRRAVEAHQAARGWWHHDMPDTFDGVDWMQIAEAHFV